MEIISAKYLISNPDVKQCPKPDRPEYAFIGRSNVGKSSLINLITNNSKLAKTSASPGKTQLINHFEIISADKKKWYLVDLPGYGYAVRAKKQRKEWGKMISDYIRQRVNLVNLFVLIDSRHDPQAIDLDFINQLGEWRIPFSIVFTKTDKNKEAATERNIHSFLAVLKKTWAELPPYFATSAITKAGREELLDFIGELNKRTSGK
ncbi:MAG: ribosome biogenesis GTP-binding protein YihA/YsxC [Chitinophagaceae bacterium]